MEHQGLRAYWPSCYNMNWLMLLVHVCIVSTIYFVQILSYTTSVLIFKNLTFFNVKLQEILAIYKIKIVQIAV